MYQLSDWAARFCEKIGSRNLLTDRQQRPDEIQISNVQGFQQKFFWEKSLHEFQNKLKLTLWFMALLLMILLCDGQPN